MRGIFWLCSCVFILIPAVVGAEDFIWIEGEDARTHEMKRHGWYDSVDKMQLSGGEWLSHFRSGPPPECEYGIDVKESGTYRLWIRCNTVARPRLSFSLDAGDWKGIDLSRSVGNINIASDGKPDMRFVAWVDAGELRLGRGKHTIRFRFHSENNNHGAIDCFLLTRGTFRPRGALKPGERSGRAADGFFAWEPDIDPFDDTALVDLRRLNEKVAGQKGRVRARGNDFVLGDGRKVKFWAANAGPGIWRLDDGAHEYLARRLAKSGVNMVRLHGSIYSSRDPRVDEGKLERIHHMVHALKKQGIYTHISFYFPLWFHLDGDRRPFMLLFFDEEMQEIYRGWAKRLLTSSNPYTRRSLGKDPAVAIVEIQNEDSHFFWTFGPKNAPEHRWKKLQKLYAGWLEKRYGSLDAAFAAWDGKREEGDDPGAGRVDLYGAWEMTTDGIRARADRRARISDQVRFLTENMRGFNEETIDYLREECGYSGLVSCGNWHVSDAAKLDALERYCYTAGDVIDHHGYFDHGHQGDAANWSVRPGQEFSSQSALHLKHNNPLPYVETEGHPHITSEIGWPLPNVYRAEAVFLTAAYGSLQGLDGIFHFALGSEGWDDHVGKFALSTPVGLGSFPAAALLYRKGYVREAPPVVMDRLELEDLYALKGTAVHVAGALDQFRAADIPAAGQRRGSVQEIDPLSFYAGRVVRSFEGDPDDSFQRGLGDRIDRDGRVIRSITDELTWDYGRGVVTIETETARGAAGFLGRAGPVELGGVSIEMKNDYGTVLIVCLDDRPLPRSRKLLIQCLTVERPFGFRAAGPGSRSGRIESVGGAPWGVELLDVRLDLPLEGTRPVRVTACDEHGYPRSRSVKTSRRGDTLRVTLDASSPYHVLQR